MLTVIILKPLCVSGGKLRLNVKCCEMRCTEVLMEETMMRIFFWKVNARSLEKTSQFQGKYRVRPRGEIATQAFLVAYFTAFMSGLLFDSGTGDDAFLRNV
jgi:hypothetical protein